MDDRATSPRVARSDATARLVRSLEGWGQGSGPLYRLLARALTAAVERGDIDPGARLPSERAFAAALAVSRGVVVAAYDDLIGADVVDRVPGSGTFVAGGGGRPLPKDREGSRLVGRLVDQGGPPSMIDLSISVLHDATSLPSVQVGTADLAIEGADSPWGLPAMRALVADRLSGMGLASDPAQVVVTTGAQQGVSLAAGCWIRPGDVVVVDDPSYPGALSAFAAAGALVRAVPVDRKGIVLRELERALDEGPALVYLQSGPHSPTGGRLSTHRRATIARWLVERRIPVVEDLALAGLDWSDGPPAAPLAAHAPEHPIAVVGSFSKVFWAGLRVGFVRAPAPLARRLARVKATHDLGSSAVSQAMAVSLVQHEDHPLFLERRNRSLAQRATLLSDLLAAELPAWRCELPDPALSLWVRLPLPVATRFAEVALRHGVGVATAEGLSADPGAHRDRLRLTFAVSTVELRAAVPRLSAAWAELVA